MMCSNLVTNTPLNRTVTDVSEETASMRFIQKYYNLYRECSVQLNIKPLTDIINEVCLAEVTSRRTLMLYYHSDSDHFSNQICTYIKDDDIVNLINDSFNMLAWDISSADVHNVLKEALKQHFDLDIMVNLVSKKESAVFLITAVSSVVSVFSFMHGSITLENFKLTLLQAAKAVKEEFDIEQQLQVMSQSNTHPENDIDSKRFQQIMFDQLGDRDYDSFECSEHEQLKKKIGFALFGPPKHEDGYVDKESKQIEEVYKKIVAVNNEFSKWTDRVVISFIYNCTEPVPKEKVRMLRGNADYNPSTDLCPLPVFVLRKCKGSREPCKDSLELWKGSQEPCNGSPEPCKDSLEPCRVFIDHDKRVYQTWKEYLLKNKLRKCKMIVPRNGRYQGDVSGNVILEEHFSPACEWSTAVLQGVDVASATVGLASGSVFLAAMVPAIPVAPIVLTAAGAAGILVGVYSVTRSSCTLFDRWARQQSLSLANNDARGAYINIVAGSLGFVGAGATTLVSKLSANGVNIGQGVRIVVNTINGANIATGGIGIVNSTYDLIYQYFVEERTPSGLTILQLSSSVLFFGNAVYNFKSISTIIEESQTRVLKDIQDSLRSNRHRKTYNKLLKETLRQNGESQGRAEVIATLKNMNQRDDILAVLTRSSKSFNKDGIRFSAQNGDILLNGIKVDILNYGSMQKFEQAQLHLEMPPIPDTFIGMDQGGVLSRLQKSFDICTVTNLLSYSAELITNQKTVLCLISELLGRFITPIQNKIIQITRNFITYLKSDDIDVQNILKKISPNTEVLYTILNFVIGFIEDKVNQMEHNYQEELSRARLQSDFNMENFNARYNPIKAQRMLNFFSAFLAMFTESYEQTMEKLMNKFKELLSVKIFEYDQSHLKKKTRQECQKHERKQEACKVCGGYYYV